jgi:hypothetical protein
MKPAQEMTRLEIVDLLHNSMSVEHLQLKLSEYKKLRRKYLSYGLNMTVFPFPRKEAIERIEYAIIQKTTTTSAH